MTDLDYLERKLAHLYRLPCAQRTADDAHSRGYQMALADVRKNLAEARNVLESSRPA